MASIYRPSYGRKGASKRLGKWYVKYKDASGTVRVVPGYTDRHATELMAARLEKAVALEREGVVDPCADERKRPLVDHVDDFRRALVAREDTPKHVGMTVQRIRRVLGGCGFRVMADLSASRIEEWLADRRAEGLSIESSNHYLRASKAFSRWLLRNRKNDLDPLVHLSTLNADPDLRHRRRALTKEEFERLWNAAREGGDWRGVSGSDRAMLYLIAVQTALRKRELASLMPRSFSLDLDPPRVTLAAAHSKHRHEDVLPLRPDLADTLRRWFADKKLTPAVLLWAGTWPERASKMLRRDLEAASIPYEVDGTYLDFHALRHTGITWVAASGAHPKAVQTFARHGSIKLTMDRYAHFGLVDLGVILASLPPVPGSGPKQDSVAATGTAHAHRHAPEKDMRRHSVTPGGTTTRGEKRRADRPKSEADGGKAGDDAALEMARVRGLEPPTFGSTIRCSRPVELHPRVQRAVLISPPAQGVKWIPRPSQPGRTPNWLRERKADRPIRAVRFLTLSGSRTPGRFQGGPHV